MHHSRSGDVVNTFLLINKKTQEENKMIYESYNKRWIEEEDCIDLIGE